MWVSVAGYEDHYQVNAEGQVRRIAGGMRGARAGKILKPTPARNGYLTVKLHKNGDGGKTYAVHQLVWFAFKGEVPKGFEINHKDLNKGNASLGNLELLTRQQNIQHAIAHGVRYDTRGNAILTEDNVRFIRASYVPYKFSRVKLAQMFGVTVECIKGVLYGSNWKEVK